MGDDSIKKDDETIGLSLPEPCNAAPGTTIPHTYSILDNNEALVWDGLLWYYSMNSGGPFVNADGQLEWDPQGEGQFITRIGAQSLMRPGDKVKIACWWMTDGVHDCPEGSCLICDRCPVDIRCISGTSDMRAGLYEADGEYVQQNGLGLHHSIFVGYKGYNFRFGPNLDPSIPTRWVDCYGEVHKTGNFAKKPADLDNLMRINEGLTEYIPGFGLAPGEWSPWTISLERLSAAEVELSITLNDATYTWIDSSSSEQPIMIDVFGIHMRNDRPYNRLVLGPICMGLAGDLDGDNNEQWDDLSIFVNQWLNRCRPTEGYCAGADINRDFKVNFTDFALLAADWFKACP
jgi:hypothetical protein